MTTSPSNTRSFGSMEELNKIIDSYMAEVPEIKALCDACLNTKRYGGDVVLMVVDAAFVSVGMNYFTSVIPKVTEFERRYISKIKNLSDLSRSNTEDFLTIWKNKRSWNVAKEVAHHLSTVDDNDITALTKWARECDISSWKNDPIGKINGVGINTFQYLRMMGGADTVMPDKVVKRVFNDIGGKAGINFPKDDIEFIMKIEEVAKKTGYKPIELCWMTWFVQYKKEKRKKYLDIMLKI